MPMRLLPPCSYPRCAKRSVAHGRCAAHAHALDSRLSARDRGYDSRWEKIRAAHLRDEPLCRMHLSNEDFPVPATEVDHIVPRVDGGSDEDSNLQSLCKSCHSSKTRREINARRVG